MIEGYPKIGNTVKVEVKEILKMGVLVSLLEYNKEGLIIFSEFSRRPIPSPDKVIKVGEQFSAIVINKDEEKGYIDLSKRRIMP